VKRTIGKLLQVVTASTRKFLLPMSEPILAFPLGARWRLRAFSTSIHSICFSIFLFPTACHSSWASRVILACHKFPLASSHLQSIGIHQLFASDKMWCLFIDQIPSSERTLERLGHCFLTVVIINYSHVKVLLLATEDVRKPSRLAKEALGQMIS